MYVDTTAVEVSCLPQDLRYEHGRSFTLTVEYKGNGLWAVMQGRFCLGTDGDLDF